jgi:hypothetical protein
VVIYNQFGDYNRSKLQQEGDFMKPRIMLLGLVVVAALAVPRMAWAQYPGIASGHSDNPNGPTVSPYLNLLQNPGGNLPNYQTLVKPLVDQGNALQRQGGAIQRLQQSQGFGGGAGGRQGTGHTTYFMNYSHFYPTRR